MQKVLAAAGREFLRAGWAVFLPAVFGIINAADVQTAVALSIAALAASIAAGIKAAQVFVPQLSFVALLPTNLAHWGAWIDSFLRGFISGGLVFLVGWLAAPNLDDVDALLMGLIVGALNAAFRAVEGATTKGEQPAPQSGVSA